MMTWNIIWKLFQKKISTRSWNLILFDVVNEKREKLANVSHVFFTIRMLRKANPCFIMRYVEFCLFLDEFTMVNIIEYIEVNL